MDNPFIIIDELSRQIASAMKTYTMEAHFPSSNPDDMDDKLKYATLKRDTLRRIRQEYEELMFGVTPQ